MNTLRACPSRLTMSWRRRSCSTGSLRGRPSNTPGPWAGHGRRRRLLQMREPAARRLLQGPRRLCAHGQALRRGEDTRRGGRLRRQPRPGRGGRRASAWASRPASTCRSASRCPSSPPPAATAPRWSCTATTWTRRSPKRSATRDETGAVFVHPFDDADIIAGQGTVGLEILEQVPDVDTILMGVGGGGLLAGVAVAVKAQGQGAGPGDPRHRRPGRERRRLPALARRGRPGPAQEGLHHGRRHRRGPAGPAAVQHHPGTRRRRASPSAKTPWPGR